MNAFKVSVKDGVYRMRWVRGLELFGRVTRGGVMVIEGEYSFGVAKDWLMEQGWEVVVER